MANKQRLLLWEAALTFLTICSASLSLTTLIPNKVSSAIIIVVQALNGATVVYKTGQWNPNAAVMTAIQNKEVPPE